jgi:hypothetical protein
MRCIQNPTYVVETSRGAYSLFERRVPGGMVSGSRLTTIGNGTARVNSLYETGAVAPMANGDDGLGWRAPDQTIEDVVELYGKLGLNGRGLQRCSREYFEFCSHGFDTTSGKAWLLSWPKALYRMATKGITDSLAEDFLREVRHHPRVDELAEAVDRMLTAPAQEERKTN